MFGFSDDSIWRAVVRRLALDYRQVLPLFYDLMTIIFGPRRTVSSVLAENVAINDDTVSVTDWMNIPQRGVLVIDEGLASAETIEYTFRDPRNGVVTLESIATKVHTAVVNNALGYLTAAIAPAAVTLVLEDTSQFPIPAGGAQYTMIVDQGEDNEEVVLLSANVPATSTLTIAAGLVNNHAGPTPTPTTGQVLQILAGGSVLKLNSTRNFPAQGLIRVQQDVLAGTPTITLRYVENDVDNDLLTLAKPASGAYTLPGAGTVTVTLMKPGATVQMAQVQVKGVGWDIFQTRPKLVQIYLPPDIIRNRLVDASFLHSAVIASPPALTATAGATVGDTILCAVATDPNILPFPSSGIIVINSGGGTEEYIGYTIPDQVKTEVLTSVAAGVTEIYVNDVKALKDCEIVNPDKWVCLSQNSVVRYERVKYTDLDLATNKITLAAVTAKAHNSIDTVGALNAGSGFYLSRPLAHTHLAAEPVSLVQIPWVGTLLEDGRISFTPGSRKFSGHYVYDPASYYARTIQTTLAENLAGPIGMTVDQHLGRFAIEVKNAELFNAAGAFSVRLSRGGDEETILTQKVVTRATFKALGVVTTTGTAGAFVLTVVGMPIWIGDLLGIRLLVNAGTATEEVVILKKVVGATSITLEEPLVYSHGAAEPIVLMSDVILLTEGLVNNHFGYAGWTQRKVRYPGRGHCGDPGLHIDSIITKVEEIRTRIDVVSAATLPATEDGVLINFGNQKIMAENQIAADTAAASGTITLVNSAAFPVVGYPYMVEVGVDCDVLEILGVAGNVANVLTLSGTTQFAHKKGEWVRYRPGATEKVTYTSTVTGGPERLLFADGIRFTDSHLKGEVVSLNNRNSIPSKYGTDYPLTLPADWMSRLQYLFDHGRAAGVQIVIIDSK